MPNPTTPTADADFHELLMLYGRVCSEEGFLGQKAVEMRMGIASTFTDCEREAERRGRLYLVNQLLGNEDYKLGDKYFKGSITADGQWVGEALLSTLEDEWYQLTHPKKEDI